MGDAKVDASVETRPMMDSIDSHFVLGGQSAGKPYRTRFLGFHVCMWEVVNEIRLPD